MEEKGMKESMKDRRLHGERKCDQPWTNWEWMRFPGSPMKSEMNKEKRGMEFEAEFETDGDLTKSIPQLVCDFNFEILKLGIGAKEERILLTALKRMVAMMAQVAMKSDKVSDQMIQLTNRITDLTRWLLRLTVVIAILTLAMVVIPPLIKK
jgi:hypothetical protein